MNDSMYSWMLQSMNDIFEHALVSNFTLWLQGLEQDHCYTCLSMPAVSIGSRAWPTFACHIRLVKVSSSSHSHQLGKSLQSYWHVSYMFFLHIIYTRKLLIFAIWPILCWSTIKRTKTKTDLINMRRMLEMIGTMGRMAISVSKN